MLNEISHTMPNMQTQPHGLAPIEKEPNARASTRIPISMTAVTKT
jgi:hypothetical protein